MDLSIRLMRAGDMPACVDLIKRDPIVGPRYGAAIKLLPAVWARQLGQESFRAFVGEVADYGRRRIILVGIAVFVADDFVRRLKTPPFVWIGPELTQRIAKGLSPLLSDHEVTAANSCGTLNCVLWSGCIHPQYTAEPEVHNFSVRSFIEVHSGYYLRELIGQAENEGHLQQVLGSGGLVLCDRKGTYAPPCAEDIPRLWQRPHVLGITRELAERQIGTWISTIFRYRRPRLSLSRKQQRLLTTAMNGNTDRELAAELGISLAVVKKSWRDIYDRIYDRVPELFPAEESQKDSSSERGKAKKHRLLAYMREHPQELRPIARTKCTTVSSEAQVRRSTESEWKLQHSRTANRETLQARRISGSV